jgi:lipoate-protein ligase A
MAGIKTERSGRNDLLADGQKFSGNAFYHSQGHAYHHGTLLIDADMDKLSRYLTPSKAKMEAKGVSSVRSRVINLQSLSPTLTCDKMCQYMEAAFSAVYGLPASTLSLTPDALAQIEEGRAQLQSWEWLYGPRLPFSFACEERFSWGSISLQLQVESGYVKTAQVYSDAMEWELAEKVSQALSGCRFICKDMQDSLKATLEKTQICEDLCELIMRQNI